MGKFSTFILGGAIGAAAALLLTPRTGAENQALVKRQLEATNFTLPVSEQTRERVSAQAGQLIEAAASTSTKVINTVVDNGSEAYKTVSTRASEIASPAAQSFAENGDELREKIEAARERIATQVAKNAEAARDVAVDKIPGAVDAASAAADAAKGAVADAKEAVAGAGAAVAAKVPGMGAHAAAEEAPAEEAAAEETSAE